MEKTKSPLLHPLLQSVTYRTACCPGTLPYIRPTYQHLPVPPVCADSSGSLSGRQRLLAGVSFEALAREALVPPPIFLAFTPWVLSESLLAHKGWSGIRFPKGWSLRGRISRREERDKSVLGELQAEASVSLACFAEVNEPSGSGRLPLALFFACISEC